MNEREFYVSSSGDRWLLVGDRAAAQVEHRANAAAGGAVTRVSLDAFLAAPNDNAEHQALRRLLADAPASMPNREISVIDEVERMGDEIEDRPGPHSDPAY